MQENDLESSTEYITEKQIVKQKVLMPVKKIIKRLNENGEEEEIEVKLST
jgi:hypothetical protein